MRKRGRRRRRRTWQRSPSPSPSLRRRMTLSPHRSKRPRPPHGAPAAFSRGRSWRRTPHGKRWRRRATTPKRRGSGRARSSWCKHSATRAARPAGRPSMRHGSKLSARSKRRSGSGSRHGMRGACGRRCRQPLLRLRPHSPHPLPTTSQRRRCGAAGARLLRIGARGARTYGCTTASHESLGRRCGSGEGGTTWRGCSR